MEKARKKNLKQDKRSVVDNSAESQEKEKNYFSASELNDSSKSIEEKLDDFINRIQDESTRENCFKKLDDHINNLLETVKLKERKRKNTKQTLPATETNGLDKIDLTTPDSILSQINLKNVFNVKTFNSLPLYYQYKLIKLLPKCDQVETPEGWLNMSSTALNNEYFTKAYRYWLKQLKESKLNSEFIQKCKVDLEKERQKLDPFKVKNFEPIWSEPLPSKLNCEELLEKERLNKCNLKRKKKQENNNLNDLNLKLIFLNSTNQNSKLINQKQKSNKKRTVTPKTRQKLQTTSNSQTTPIKGQNLNSSLESLNTSPLSVGSITVKKTINSLTPINPLTTAEQSSTNNKLFFISNHGKLLQIQQPNFQLIEVPKLSEDQSNGRKRKIDLDDNSANDLIVNINNPSTVVADDGQPILNSNQAQTSNILNIICECEKKPLINCNLCNAFCHSDCLNSSNVCVNCLKNT